MQQLSAFFVSIMFVITSTGSLATPYELESSEDTNISTFDNTSYDDSWLQDSTNIFPFDQHFDDYIEYNEVYENLTWFADQYPDIVKLHRLTDIIPQGSTWRDNHIYALKISDGVQNEVEYYDDPDEETFLVVGNHHAREWMTVVAPMYFIHYLTYFYGMEPTDNDGDGLINEDPLDGIDNDGDGEQGGKQDANGNAMWDGIDNDNDGIIDEGIDEDPIEARVTQLVDTREIWIIPLLNPDGYQYDRCQMPDDNEDNCDLDDRFWRKNLRDGDNDDRVSECDGVDLNRNYPIEWSHNTQNPNAIVTEGGVEYTVDDDNPCSDVYHGPRDFNDDDGDCESSGIPGDCEGGSQFVPIAGVDEDPNDSYHKDDDGDGLFDEDQEGGFSEPETQVIEYLTWRLDIYDWENNPWDVDEEGASEHWPAMWTMAHDDDYIRNYRTEKHDGKHNIVNAISYHSCSALYIWPWGFKGEDPPHEDIMKDLANPLMNWTGYGNWKEEDGYKVSGDITDWLYGMQGIFAYTIELNQCGSQGNLSGGFHADTALIKPTVRMHLLSNMHLLDKSAEAQIASDNTMLRTVDEVRFPSIEILSIGDYDYCLGGFDNCNDSYDTGSYFFVNDDYPVQAKVTNADHLAHHSLQLMYRTIGDEDWNEADMICLSGCNAMDKESIVKGIIPSIEDSNSIEYYIIGQDSRSASGVGVGGGFVYSGYGAAAPNTFFVDEIIGFGNAIVDAIAVGLMMFVMYGIVWGGLYHFIGVAAAADRRKAQ